jgi:hypothetical protein
MEGLLGPTQVNWTFGFDRVLVSPSGHFEALYTVTGTKGLIAARNQEVREVNRSYYCASAYEYPIALGRLADGREVLAHCPEGYNRLTLEVLADGTPLAAATDRAEDVFQSRLSFSPDGRHLLSSGWIWHPVGVVQVYELETALDDPTHFDGGGVLPWIAVDSSVEAACWLSNGLLLVATDPEDEAFGNEGTGLHPGEVGGLVVGRMRLDLTLYLRPTPWDDPCPRNSHLELVRPSAPHRSLERRGLGRVAHALHGIPDRQHPEGERSSASDCRRRNPVTVRRCRRRHDHGR